LTPKLLPLPVGARAPQGSTIRFWHQYGFRAHTDTVLLLAGLALAGAGAWIGTRQAPITVGVDRAGYHLGATVLSAVGGGRYLGESAVVIKGTPGQVRAAAAGKLGQLDMQGTCVLVIQSRSEQCAFVVGTKHFRSVDLLRGATWERRYDNGLTVEVNLADPAHPTPVPIPLGWH
jgi:hypothetical protein